MRLWAYATAGKSEGAVSSWNRMSRNSVSGECRFDSGQEFVVVDGFNKKRDRAVIQCFCANGRIILARQNNHPTRRRNVSKPLLHLQAIHGRHQDIENDDFRLTGFSVPEKLERIGKRFHLPAGRRKQTTGRLHYRRIIVEQANSARFRLHWESYSQIFHLRDLT